jgi:hypothetical protein
MHTERMKKTSKGENTGFVNEKGDLIEKNIKSIGRVTRSKKGTQLYQKAARFRVPKNFKDEKDTQGSDEETISFNNEKEYEEFMAVVKKMKLNRK